MSVGRLIASGRDADIFEYGEHLVLKRTRHPDRLHVHEAKAMQYAADKGYPAPRVEEVREGGAEIVMERIDGPLMIDLFKRRPDRIAHYARILADLHDRLHELPAPEWLPPIGDGGGRLLHLDLHPLNVVMTARGPVVIDWANAAAGDPLIDVAFTYVLLTCPRAPVPAAVGLALVPLRAVTARVFASRYRSSALPSRIAEAARLKALDPNMDRQEVAKLRRLEARMRR
jgi:serine/threonine protein kinase